MLSWLTRFIEHSPRAYGARGLPGGSLESISGDPKKPRSTVSPDDIIESAVRSEIREALGFGIDDDFHSSDRRFLMEDLLRLEPTLSTHREAHESA